MRALWTKADTSVRRHANVAPATPGDAPVFYTLETAPRYPQLLGAINPLSDQAVALRNRFLGRFADLPLVAGIVSSLGSILIATTFVPRGEPLGSEM
jgi:hypothetical protein